jgi:hypothetical protein
MEALANPEEASKIFRLQKELSSSRYLTEVNDSFIDFEEATNKHFNREMNKLQKEDELAQDTGKLTVLRANKVLAEISLKLKGMPKKGSKEETPQPTELQMSERYDRMNRKDFSRKLNSFAPILINDNYSNFRFSKRAGEVLSPLSTKKFEFGSRSIMRKMS